MHSVLSLKPGVTVAAHGDGARTLEQ